MSKSNTPLKVLRVARKRIEKGWMKHAVFNFNGGAPTVCGLGAIGGEKGAAGSKTNTPQGLAHLYVQMAIGDYVLAHKDRFREMGVHLRSRDFISIPTFNDFEATTKEDMLAVFDAAILAAELDEGPKVITDTKPQAYEIDVPYVEDTIVMPGRVLI